MCGKLSHARSTHMLYNVCAVKSGMHTGGWEGSVASRRAACLRRIQSQRVIKHLRAEGAGFGMQTGTVDPLQFRPALESVFQVCQNTECKRATGPALRLQHTGRTHDQSTQAVHTTRARTKDNMATDDQACAAHCETKQAAGETSPNARPKPHKK